MGLLAEGTALSGRAFGALSLSKGHFVYQPIAATIPVSFNGHKDATMTDEPIPTHPLSSSDQVLRDKFAESIAAQSDLMDKLGQQLLTLELAIPGLYATVLKLLSGDDATLALTPALMFTFGCWFIALILTLLSLIPLSWNVDPHLMRQDPAARSDQGLGIEDFFRESAKYKRNLLIPACLIFFFGIVSAALALI